jgi:ketosteroid isomerase-like protein
MPTTTAAARAFVEDWLRVWRDRDGHAYAELLHPDCVFDNPIAPIPRDELPAFVDSLLAVWPDHRIEATRWAATDDGVLIEWVTTGTLAGSPIELRGADRYTLRDGKVSEGVAYFDPRPVLERQQAPAGH